MAITIAQICDAIETTLSTATTVARSQSYDELAEGVHDMPLLQVYPENGTQDLGGVSGRTDRSTFQAAVRQTELTIHADYYAAARGTSIGEEMGRLVNGIDAMTDVLEGQDQKPYFGLVGIGAFSWRWDRVTFDYAGVAYVGARFALIVTVF